MTTHAHKRNAALIPFSRDHGLELVCAQYGRKAVLADTEARIELTESMRSICRDLIVPNLYDEQWMLSPLLGDESLRQEFHKRHRHVIELLKKLVNVDLLSSKTLGAVARLSNALYECVIWEEHTLFPRIEEGAETEQLRHLLIMTSAVEKTRKRFKKLNRTHNPLPMSD